MATKRMHLTQEFNCSVEQLFAFLSVHENLSLVFAPAKIKLIKAGDTSTNGTGSIRHVVLPLPLAPVTEETVTNFIENKLIEYRITGKSPLKNHMGTLLFTELGARSRLDYHMEFDAKIPFVAPVMQFVLTNAIKRGLKKIQL